MLPETPATSYKWYCTPACKAGRKMNLCASCELLTYDAIISSSFRSSDSETLLSLPPPPHTILSPGCQAPGKTR